MDKYSALFAKPADLGPAASVYTMPSGADFLSCLAKGLHESLGADLHTALILLPTRRAVRELAAAFLDLSGGKPVLLPLMRPLADMDENEPPFEPGELALSIRPAIDEARRRFALAQLCAEKMKVESGGEVDAASALAMTDPVASLLGDMAMEEITPGALDALESGFETLPEHFKMAAKFTEIISKFWPAYLEEQHVSEPMARRVALLDAAAKNWRDNPPDFPVIAAGSTGTLAATARLLKTIAGLPKGLVVLPGLDMHMDDAAYSQIDDQHPQASLCALLNVLELSRKDIRRWPGADISPALMMRARILTEALSPADATSNWPARIKALQTSDSGPRSIEDGLSGLSLIQARHEEEEAATIAIIMRETLETPEKTCALITPDPALARRVRAKLSRWHIEVDSSAGEPLEETRHGSFLALLAGLAADPFDPARLTELVKHKLMQLSLEERQIWARLEKTALRGVRIRSVKALRARVFPAGRTHADKDIAELETAINLFAGLQDKLAPLASLAAGKTSAAEIARAHTALAEDLAGGPEYIWRGEAGEKAAALLEELISFGGALPSTDAEGYIRLLSTLMRGRVVRPRFGTHSRLQILGPLEARMLSADRIILGGLNEGVWPAAPSPHPFLSRGMRRTIGLTAPERRFGLAAHDFAEFAAKSDVILTRAERTGDGPAVMSRWLWRLTILAGGALGEDAAKAALAPSRPYLDWARNLDRAPPQPRPASRPKPAPPLSARWPNGKGLSVTKIQTLIRDPYAIYARMILGLKELDSLDQAIGGREYGIAIHAALERYAKAGDTASAGDLARFLAQALKDAGYEDHKFSRLHVRMQAMADWFTQWAETRRALGWQLAAAEEHGKTLIGDQDPKFCLSGIADRIETYGHGDEKRAAIIDYKTGRTASKKTVQAGFDPQLPLLGLMVNQGGFAPLKAQTEDFAYIKPNAAKEKDRQSSLFGGGYDADTYISEALEALKALIAHFDDETSAYHSQPRAQYTNDFGAYDQLARRAEWAALSGEDEGGKI